MLTPQKGRPFTYNPNKLDAILASVKKAKGSLGQVADLNGITRECMYHWVRRGDEDNDMDICSEIAHLSRSLRKEQAEVIVDLCKTAFTSPKKSKFIMWWLSRICREDFGVEGIELKQLREIFQVILPTLGDKNV